MSDSEPESGVGIEEWRTQVEQQREQKNDFFADHPQSPIPPEKREEFDGLEYFDPDANYRVEATVTTQDQPEPVEMETTNGPNVRYLRVVTFEFEASGETQTLAGYRQESDDSQSLFVPFRDKTTGQQTYRGGRYMEFEPSRELEDGDEVVLDFNLAYSPFCAYSETFACPLPPEENWLDVVIPAGERFEE